MVDNWGLGYLLQFLTSRHERGHAMSEPDPNLPAPALTPVAQKLVPDWARIALYVVLTLILLFLGGMLLFGVQSANANYGKGIALAEQYYTDHKDRADVRPDLSLLYTQQNSRAQDQIFIKASALFMGYVVVVIGCLFVLKGIEAAYELSVHRAELESALKTTSPGLVLITLGMCLVVATMFSHTTLETNFEWNPAIVVHQPTPINKNPEGLGAPKAKSEEPKNAIGRIPN
jgi:TRAP-type C4-dicarboxylate transport system permease small subunit